jgi:hypothetical protein
MKRYFFRPHVIPPVHGGLSSSLRLLLVICLLIAAAGATVEGAGRGALDQNAGSASLASTQENSSKSLNSVGNCSKVGAGLSDPNVCGDMPARTATMQVSEPSSLFLVGCGLLLMAALLRHRVGRIKSPESAGN